MGTVPDPQTWVDAPNPASIPTYTEFNREIFDTVNFLLNPPMVLLRQTTAQNQASDSHVIISWTTAIVDTDGIWSSGDPTKLIPKTAGLYKGWIGASWVPGCPVGGERNIGVMKNGTATSNYIKFRHQRAGTDTDGSKISKGFGFYCRFNGTTDYIVMATYQNSGSGCNTFIDNETAQPEIYMRWYAK